MINTVLYKKEKTTIKGRKIRFRCFQNWTILPRLFRNPPFSVRGDVGGHLFSGVIPTLRFLLHIKIFHLILLPPALPWPPKSVTCPELLQPCSVEAEFSIAKNGKKQEIMLKKIHCPNKQRTGDLFPLFSVGSALSWTDWSYILPGSSAQTLMQTSKGQRTGGLSQSCRHFQGTWNESGPLSPSRQCWPGAC